VRRTDTVTPEIIPGVMNIEAFTTPRVSTLDGVHTRTAKPLALGYIYVTMKRSVSNVEAVQQSPCHDGILKRRKTQHVNPEAGCTCRFPSHPSNSTSQLSHASLQQFTVTEQALENTQQPVSDQRALSLQHWLENCPGDSDPDMMAAPPTPRSASVSYSRGRRPSKHSARASRTPSPSKRPSPQTYRTQNMSYAGILIDDLTELPQEIERRVRHILQVETLDDVHGTAEHESQLATHVKRYLDQSRHNARSCSLEGDWRAILFSLMGDLAQGNVQCHTSEKRELAGRVWSTILGC
jgi:hypothetical protein